MRQKSVFPILFTQSPIGVDLHKSAAVYDIIYAMDPEFKDRIFNWSARVILLGVIVVGACFLWPTYQRERSLRDQEAELDRRLAEKRAEIRKLSENQRRFKNDRDFVELIARQKNRVFPGELVFLFEER